MTALESWGRLSRPEHRLLPLTDRRTAAAVVRDGKPGIAHGMGRSYGDVCLNPGGVAWMTRGLDRMIAFDDATGVLHCESGVLLRDIQQMLMPRGWMLPVTPGTQLITVGGAIGNDVHGKNHHAFGSFGDHVVWLKLVRSDGGTIACGRSLAPEWLAATVGGLGLTGVVVEAKLQLRRVAGPWLVTETLAYGSLDEFFALSDSSERDWEHGVSWIDCLSGGKPGGGRGIFMRANPSAETRKTPRDGKTSCPFVPPVSLVNKLSLRPFNRAYYALQAFKAGPSLAHYERFFHPLDNLLDWNRLYGPRGFYQYQSVVPRDVGQDALGGMLKEVSRSGEGSFLAVLKTFGDRQPVGLLSFPMPGVTLALDFPNHGARTERLFKRLDAIVREARGRLYPAKDARMPKDMFVAGYPRLDAFLSFRDPGMTSALSRRLMAF